jgi:hypothetical protein
VVENKDKDEVTGLELMESFYANTRLFHGGDSGSSKRKVQR